MLVVLGVEAGERVRCAMRHATRMPRDRARRQRARREGRIGGRERGCAKKAATAPAAVGAVMPLEQAGGRAFRATLVSWTSRYA